MVGKRPRPGVRKGPFYHKLAILANYEVACHVHFMPTRNINLTERQDRFVAEVMASGRYQNASEVVRDGLRMLEKREAEDAVKLIRLGTALAEADDAIGRGDFEDIAVEDLDGWLEALDTDTR